MTKWLCPFCKNKVMHDDYDSISFFPSEREDHHVYERFAEVHVDLWKCPHCETYLLSVDTGDFEDIPYHGADFDVIPIRPKLYYVKRIEKNE